MKVRGFAFSGLYYLSFYEEDGEMDRTRPALTGGVAQASYLIKGLVELAGRAAFVSSVGDFRDDAAERAARIIAAAPDADTRAALSAQYGKAGAVEQEREFVFGVNVYLVAGTSSFQNDVSYLQHMQSGDDNREDFRFRTQLQLAF